MAPIALVTGGGSGIGLFVTEHLINNHGYRVAIIDVNPERVKNQSQRLGADNCLGICADVTKYEQLAKAFSDTFLWGGDRLDVFFANAGIGDTDSLYKDMELDESTGLPKPLNMTCIDVDLLAVFQGVHLARHFFSEKNSVKGGKIVVTSSVLGLYSNYALPQYCAAKHGLVGMVRSCAPVYAKDNITINSLNPTLVDTNIFPEELQGMLSEGEVAKRVTSKSTASKAFDAVLADDSLTGQVMELALDEVVFKPQPEYSRENIRWMCGAMDVWEMICEPLLPRPKGENAVAIKPPQHPSL